MTVRQTERYQQAIAELARMSEAHRFSGSGTGSFFAWERLNALIARLERCFDAYELEGELSGVRGAIEAYWEDLGRFHLQPEPAVAAYLGRFLDDLAPGEVELETTRHVPASRAARWPQGYMAVHPEALEAHMRDRITPNPPRL